ncbi:MAG: PQQ-dependent sugar dehydrogenase, partial [Cyanobacteria bacterium J06649_11]
ANGGSSFPETELSPYSGQVSILEGPDFSTVTPLITGLPVSNHDHGINSMVFDNEGNLYIASGGNTNAGIPASKIGGIDESPFTAAILKAEITKPDFNGEIKYELPDDFTPPQGLTFDPAESQVFGDVAKVADGIDVSVYASGQRNPFGLVWTTEGLMYGTDNGPNGGFGDVSTSATTQEPVKTAPDELNLIIEDGYYGHPNRNRGQEDPRQNVYYNDKDPNIPGVHNAPLTTFSASTNGIDEYRANTFGGQMRGNLITQKWNGPSYNVTLSEDGTQVVNQETLDSQSKALDLLTGPGGAIVGINFSGDKIDVSTPNDITVSGATAYDIYPWRAPATGGNLFIIGGDEFEDLSNTQVTIGGEVAQLTSVSDNRIMGILPSFDNVSGDDLLDISVTSGGETSLLTDAFLPLSGTANFV